jgi:hypothetical protein
MYSMKATRTSGPGATPIVTDERSGKGPHKEYDTTVSGVLVTADAEGKDVGKVAAYTLRVSVQVR